MNFGESVLVVRLFSAIFLTLIGGIFIFANAVTTERFVGALFAGIGLTALYLVWLGSRSR